MFERFRGTDWMPEPCRGCDRRDVDFGGCRCQAFQLTGEAARTDPVCHLSPDHDLVTRAVGAANAGPCAFREERSSRRTPTAAPPRR
jgi:pyrroloquinoline quinone biosynthesis protein E